MHYIYNIMILIIPYEAHFIQKVNMSTFFKTMQIIFRFFLI